MKKSVIMTIGIIYILAIALVGFIGLKMKVYDEQRYVERIECITEGYKAFEADDDKYQEGFSGYISETYTEGLKIEIKCRVYPDNATNKSLEYIAAESQIYTLTINADNTATIAFHKNGVATIYIKATDNRGTQIKIEVYANKKLI